MPIKNATNKLTDPAIRNAKPQARPFNLADGGGLGLEVQPSGAKWWRFRYRIDGKEKMLSFGTHPEVSLKDARERREQARRDIAAGIDPGAKRKAEKATRAELAANTFEAVAREWHQAVHVAVVTEGHAARTLLRLEQDAFPWFGALPIAEVTAPKLLEALRKVEARGAIETAHRVRQACGQGFRYGIATGRCERDPAADLRDALQPVIVKHHAAITEPRRPFTPFKANTVWAYDFVFDTTADGQQIKCLTVVDEYTRECLAIDVAGSIRSRRVIDVLSRLVSIHGAPLFMRSDNGPEFVSVAILEWISQSGICTVLNDPGKPWQNGTDESFNGKFRDECLSLEWFRSRREAAVIIEAWRRHYNAVRPHSSLDYLTPHEFKQQYLPLPQPAVFQECLA
jgi:putative transposase